MKLWTIVIPVKGTANAKSRLGGEHAPRLAVAQAMALDTVEAVLSAQLVGEVIVVTSAEGAGAFSSLGARVVIDTAGSLNGAIVEGLAESSAPNAVVLGDVPALTPADIDAALSLANGAELSFVPDRDGSGTVLIASRSGNHEPAFGAESARRHRAAGYVELAVDAASGLRNDVDTVEQLTALGDRVGPRTARVLG